jgi:hypothetical protein
MAQNTRKKDVFFGSEKFSRLNIATPTTYFHTKSEMTVQSLSISLRSEFLSNRADSFFYSLVLV